jgi:hypothetical protein
MAANINTTEAKFRLNLALPPKIKERLESLQERSESSSVTEVIRRALALFDLVTEHGNNGGEVILKHEDGTEEKLVLL